MSSWLWRGWSLAQRGERVQIRVQESWRLLPPTPPTALSTDHVSIAIQGEHHVQPATGTMLIPARCKGTSKVVRAAWIVLACVCSHWTFFCQGRDTLSRIPHNRTRADLQRCAYRCRTGALCRNRGAHSAAYAPYRPHSRGSRIGDFLVRHATFIVTRLWPERKEQPSSASPSACTAHRPSKAGGGRSGGGAGSRSGQRRLRPGPRCDRRRAH